MKWEAAVLGDIVLHHGSGASDFERVGSAWDVADLEVLMFNVRRLLNFRGARDAVALLDAIPFSIYPATNHFNDDFYILHADLPLADYESLRVTQKEKRRAAGEVVAAIAEAKGPYIRFVAVGLALADPESWDVFLCHASEDKTVIARPLHTHLEASGIRSWLDEAQIAWGESLVGKIQDGLARARFVIVILSETFLQKRWAAKELRTALTLEVEAGRSLVLPLLVGDPDVLLASLPFLREKRYVVWQGDPALVESELRRLVRSPGLDGTSPAAVQDARHREEFDKLRRRILHVTIMNDYPSALHAFRSFLIDTGLSDRPPCQAFFERWLTSPFIVRPSSVPNAFTPNEIRQMTDALRGLQL